MSYLVFKGTIVSSGATKSSELSAIDKDGNSVSAQDNFNTIFEDISDANTSIKSAEGRIDTLNDDVTELKKVSFALDGTILRITIEE